MKDYAAMSDFEINCHVAIALGMKEHFFMGAGGDGDFDDEIPLTERGPIWQTCKYRVGAYKPSNGNCFNPCNNPSDAWPIIIGQKLSLINADDEWLCAPDDSTVDGVTGEDIQTIYFSYGYVDANPLRCAMIVFLMMKEGE